MFTRGKLVFLLSFFLLFFAVYVLSYDNLIIHPNLTELAIDVYDRAVGDKLTNKQADWIIKGSIDEDNDPRYLNHFYNPQTGQGLNEGWFHGQSAKDWAFNQDSATGDYSVGAIFDNYKNDNLVRAYQGIGHILHLVQDMSVPAHVRNDAHPNGDPFEEWTKRYGTLNINKTQKLDINNIENVFDQLSLFTNNNFFSEDTTIGVEINKYTITEELYNNQKIKYLINSINEGSYRIAIIDESSIIPIIKISRDFKLNLDYWNMLYPKAVGYSAGVIEYFIKEFEKIDQEKNEIKISLSQRIKNSVNNFLADLEYLWGDTFIASRTRIDNTLASTLGIYNKSQQEFEFFAEANREVLTDLGQKSAEIAKDLSGKVLSVEEDAAESVEILLETEIKKVENQENETIGVARVIDGDTIELTTGEKVRYIGIDTPELNSEGPNDDECLAWLAKVRNMELLGRGDLELVKDPSVDKDKYGRLLRYAYSGGLFINKQLVLDGLAETFFCQPSWENCPATSDKNRESVIIEANQEAKDNYRGIYSGVCDEEKTAEKLVSDDFKEEKLEVILDKNFSKKNIASTSTSIIQQLPLVCAPTNVNSLDTNLERVNVIPKISNFLIFNITSSSTDFTASTTVSLNYEINNQKLVEGYFLSEASTTPDINDKNWATSSPEKFILSEIDGEKNVYFWLKYNGSSMSESVSSTIALDTASPIIPTITSIEPLSDIC